MYIFCIAKNAHLGTSNIYAKRRNIIAYHMHIVIIRVLAIPKEEFGEDWSDLIGDILVDIIDEQEGNKIESDNREDSIN